VNAGISAPRPIASLDARRPAIHDVAPPVEGALAPYIRVSREHQRHEQDDLCEPSPSEIAQGHGPRVEKRDLDVEQKKNHGNEVELHRLTLTRVADGWHAAFIRRL